MMLRCLIMKDPASGPSGEEGVYQTYHVQGVECPEPTTLPTLPTNLADATPVRVLTPWGEVLKCSVQYWNRSRIAWRSL